jgi:myo-inositol-1(or 4)-monophosphatase
LTAAATIDIAARMARAESVARRAGALALEHFHARDRLVIEAKRHPTDLVSEADREVETLIRRDLAGAFPDDAQLGEEHGLSPGTSGLTWVIDPIDGTAPYLNGLPGWCVSIGACDAEGPAIGVIYAPVLGEMFVSARGQGGGDADDTAADNHHTGGRRQLVGCVNRFQCFCHNGCP